MSLQQSLSAIMIQKVKKGGPDSGKLPLKSLGIIFYNELKTKNLDKIAVINVETGEKITYGTLLDLSTKLATELRKFVKKGDTVTIMAQNNWRYIVTVLSSFYIGAQINVLNPDYTTEELKHFFSICPPKLLFCSKKALATVLDIENKTLIPKDIILFDSNEVDKHRNFDRLLAEVEPVAHFCPTELDPKQEVALIFTSSGTTGLPKCVMTTHANYRVTFLHFGDPSLQGATKEDTLIGYLPFFHIWGNMISLASVLYDAKLVILPSFKPNIFLKTIQDHKVTKLYMVPQTLDFLAKSPLVDSYDTSSVTDIFVGSGSMSPELAKIVKNRLKPKSIRTIYGTTETTAGILMMPKNVEKAGSVGKITPTFQLKICDVATGELLGADQFGELRIKGEGLMKGYLNNSEATLAALDEDGFFKTGDLCYYDEEEFFYIVDRLKDIIKCKSFQVSPAELELLLIQHPAVKEAGVVGKPDEKDGEIPVAFVVKEPNANITEEELIRYIDGKVSGPKRLRGGLYFIDEIPKTSVGKVFRRKLKDLI